jgi:hypothetical protein
MLPAVTAAPVQMRCTDSWQQQQQPALPAAAAAAAVVQQANTGEHVA